MAFQGFQFNDTLGCIIYGILERLIIHFFRLIGGIRMAFLPDAVVYDVRNKSLSKNRINKLHLKLRPLFKRLL